jgi:hypothetical protein
MDDLRKRIETLEGHMEEMRENIQEIMNVQNMIFETVVRNKKRRS